MQINVMFAMCNACGNSYLSIYAKSPLVNVIEGMKHVYKKNNQKLIHSSSFNQNLKLKLVVILFLKSFTFKSTLITLLAGSYKNLS